MWYQFEEKVLAAALATAVMATFMGMIWR